LTLPIASNMGPKRPWIADCATGPPLFVRDFVIGHQSQSQSNFTTGGLPPMSSSWRQVPWGSRPENFL
jgi:hypothetical protein